MPDCQVCARANITRLKFPSILGSRATEALYRIHTDICGPLPAGYGGFKYFALYVDCFSRYTGVGFLRDRSEAFTKFEIFIKAAERKLQKHIAVIRVDNVPELVEGKFREYCKAKGITYEKTVPDASPQNGVAERSNRTMASMARAMLLDAKISDYFWPLAIQAAIHIKNRVPHRALPREVSPYERWFGHKPSINHFRRFGCKVTARKLNSDTLPKLAPRGEQGVMMGYAQDAKGYLIWFPHANNIRVRRDVNFHDDNHPLLSPPTFEHSERMWDDIILPNLSPTIDHNGDESTGGAPENNTMGNEPGGIPERTAGGMPQRTGSASGSGGIAQGAVRIDSSAGRMPGDTCVTWN